MAAAINITRSKTVRIGVVVILAAAVAAAGYFLANFVAGRVSTQDYTVVYSTGNKTVIDIGGNTLEIDATGAGGFLYDGNRRRMYYTVDSAYRNETFDLYYTELDLSGKLCKPKLVDYGIESGYSSCDASNYLCYTKQSESGDALEGCSFDVENRRITVFSSSVKALYVPEYSQEIYFTRLHSDESVLYRYTMGSKAPEQISRNVVNVHLFDTRENTCLFFESATRGAQTVGLNVVHAGERPVLICDAAVKADYDLYTAGGNLYYYTGSGEDASWRQVISDSLYESDSVLAEPKEQDYFSFFGISLGYSKAKLEYSQKLKRDEIRQALDVAFASGNLGAPVYDVYVYNSECNKKLCSGIDPESVISSAPVGEPKLIFESKEVKESELDVASLQDIYNEEGINAAVEYAGKAVNDSVVGGDVMLAVYYSGTVGVYPVEGFAGDTDFSFSPDGERVFAFSRESAGESLSVYSSTFSRQRELQKPRNVDSGVSSYKVDSSGLTYLKLEDGKNYGSVFTYKQGERRELSGQSYAFISDEGENVLSLKNYSSTGEGLTADYYYCTAKGEKLVAENVFIESVMHSENGRFAFLTSENGSTAAKICENGKCFTVCPEAYRILYIY